MTGPPRRTRIATRLPTQPADPHLAGNPQPLGHGRKRCPTCHHLATHNGCDMCPTCQLTAPEEVPDD